MNHDWLPLQFTEGLEDMIESWIETRADDVGLCLLCGLPIHNEDDLIPGTDVHRCPKGMAIVLRAKAKGQ